MAILVSVKKIFGKKIPLLDKKKKDCKIKFRLNKNFLGAYKSIGNPLAFSKILFGDEVNYEMNID